MDDDNKITVAQVMTFQTDGEIEYAYSIEIPGDAFVNCITWQTLKELQTTLNNFIDHIEEKGGLHE